MSAGGKRSISRDGPGSGAGVYSTAYRVLEIMFSKGIKEHKLRVEDPTQIEIGEQGIG